MTLPRPACLLNLQPQRQTQAGIRRTRLSHGLGWFNDFYRTYGLKEYKPIFIFYDICRWLEILDGSTSDHIACQYREAKHADRQIDQEIQTDKSGQREIKIDRRFRERDKMRNKKKDKKRNTKRNRTRDR